MEWIFTREQINEVANAFWQHTAGSTVFAFHGEMGAGKTTFIHALCDEKKITDTVGSPTFSLINEYQYPSGSEENPATQSLFHMDLYRLRDEEEAIRAGVEDILYSGNICLVEWPEKAPGIFPPDTCHVYLSLSDTHTRRLKIGDN
ncbi:MAG: tRNA (adenosine(37)-N6)-threonylcarbamoyltransferase complex ATPase subunit type 1 TsaE [Bacteroidetes bacterium]|nr:tRNA (adenosine(37)-N6)-threonylcarbamoyltransferase complex ATPase subunit type 1 TsaE [Bacteroidota bacterium]